MVRACEGIKVIRKYVKTRKTHMCWCCDAVIPVGSKAHFSKIYPSESKAMGLIDVVLPFTSYVCMKCKGEHE